MDYYINLAIYNLDSLQNNNKKNFNIGDVITILIPFDNGNILIPKYIYKTPNFWALCDNENNNILSPVYTVKFNINNNNLNLH